MHENAIDRLPPESTNAPEDPALVPDNPDRTDADPAVQPQERGVGNNVTSAVDAAVTQVRADAVAIAELCQLAGQPGLTLSFLSEGASVAQVRKTLLAGRAQGTEISSLIHPDAASTAASPEQNPLMKAVKKLTGKD